MPKQKLKNYTTTIPAEKSLSAIESLLYSFGAQRIVKDYNSEKSYVSALRFEINWNGKFISFKLPAKVEACFEILMSDVKREQDGTRKRKWLQANMICWKILHEWLANQLSLIQLEQASIQEVFLPYLYFPKQDRTLFEQIDQRGMDGLYLTE